MRKLYRNELDSSIREGDTVTDKGFGRTFIAESDAKWDENIRAYVVKANTKWLEVSATVDIECEEITEDMYVF